jgi:Na+/proline symporter
MLQGWVVIVIALGYIGFLFLVASYGDRRRVLAGGTRSRMLIYPLSLAIYCTSWTFFGSVGLASRTGFDFLAIYIGPVLVVGLAYPLIIRIVRLAKGQNITSIADFIAARYGKSQAVAATVALIAIVGMVPYIALQLKAVSSSVSTILAQAAADGVVAQPFLGDIALFVALLMAAFAVLFGTRHIDATEHQDGLMLAIATESIVKLVAFLAVGIFVTFVMFPGPWALFARALSEPTASLLTHPPPLTSFCAMTVLSLFAILLLPRQFHVGVVENHSEAEIRRAAWLFPLYLVLINLFVVPIATAGLLSFPADADGDMFVLALPLKAHSEIFALIAFVGGLSAATAMVIVESVALAIMVSNDIVIPLVLKRRAAGTGPSDAGAQLLMIRRVAIFVILCLAYIYYRSAGPAQLASIGLLSFAAIAQFAPAFLGGLIWRRGNARGAIAGMSAGILVWGYTLLLPSLSDADILGARVLTHGLFGLAWLRPQALFGLDLPPLVHGVLLSLTVNIVLFVGCSLSRRRTAIESVQADLFVPSTLAPRAPSFRLRRPSVTVEELTVTVARYLGEERTRESFSSFAASRRVSLEPEAEADFQLIQYGEYLLASAIGAASSRLVLSLLLRKRTVSTKDALKLLDDANAAIHYNREILQTALDHVRQGIAVFDKELVLVCWNRQFGELFDLPHALTRVGISLDEILRNIARQRGHDGAELDAQVRDRIARYTSEAEPFLERFAERGLVIEVRANRMPDGGLVTTSPTSRRSRRRQCLEDPLRRRREPRHPAAAQRRPALCHQPDRAPARRRGRRSRAQCRCLAGGGRGDFRRAPRHFPARHRRDETGNDRLPHRRVAAAAGDGVCAAGAGEGSRAQIHALRADGALGSPPAAAAPAEPRLQRDQIHAGGERAGRLPPPRRAAAHRGPRHRHRHSARQAPRGVQGIPPPRPGRAGRARSRPRPLHRRAHRPRARLRGDAQIRCRPRFALFRRGAAREGGCRQAGAARGSPRRRSAHGDERPLHRQ